MKKLLLIIPILLIITGCGEVKIKCNKNYDKNSESIIATTKNNKILKITMEDIKVFDNNQELDEEYNNSKTSLYLYKLINGIKVDVSKNGNTIKEQVTIDLDKTGNNVIRKFLDLVEFTPSAFLEYAQNEGFTCN